MFEHGIIKIKTDEGIKKYVKVPMNVGKFGKPKINWKTPPDGYILCDGKYVNGEYTEEIHIISYKLFSMIWNKVINPLSKDKYYHITDIAREIIKNIKFADINKYIVGNNTSKTITAQWERTQKYTNKYKDFEYGTLMGNRASNFNLVYYPLKTMHSLGLIYYCKSPTLCKIKNNNKIR